MGTPACEGTCLAARNLWHSAPGLPSQPAAPSGDSDLNSVPCRAPAHQLYWVRSLNPFAMPLSVLPVQLDSVGMNCTFTLVSFLAEPLHICAQGPCPAMPQLPLFKKSLCGTHTATPSHGQALCTLDLPPKQKVSLIQGCPQPDGASDSFRR